MTAEVKPARAKAQRAAPKTHAHNAPAIDIRVILVDPEMAKRWLSSNAEENRTVRATRVEAYARDMKEGRWQLTGETVKIDDQGILIDGQHRLRAIVAADTPVYIAVAFNLPHSAMDVLDSGISRTLGDKLKGAHNAYRNQIASVVRRIYLWDAGDMMGKGNSITHAELLFNFEQDPAGYTAATMHGIDVARQKICSASSGGTAFYLFQRLNTEQALQYFDQLKTGANLPEQHPVLTVRNRLSRTNVRRETRLTPQDQLALLVRGWNAFRQNRTLDRIPIAKGQLNNGNHPVPV